MGVNDHCGGCRYARAVPAQVIVSRPQRSERTVLAAATHVCVGAPRPVKVSEDDPACAFYRVRSEVATGEPVDVEQGGEEAGGVA